MSEHENENEAIPPEDAQEAPGATESEFPPDEPSDSPEGQDGDASPAPEGDSPGEPESSDSPAPEQDGEAPSGDVGPDSDATGTDEPAASADIPAEVADIPVEVAELDDPEPSEMELAFADISRANEKVRKAREYLEKRQGITKSAKEEEKEAEARLDLAIKELEETIDESDRFPLIHYGKSKPERARPQAAKVVDPKPKKKAEEPKPAEPWRAVKLDTLGLPKGIMAKLDEASIFTVGDITDLTSQPYKSLQDIPGIGATAEAKIADALIKFWGDNPQYKQGEPDKVEAKPADNPAPEIADAPADEAPATIPFPDKDAAALVAEGQAADDAQYGHAAADPAQEHGSEPAGAELIQNDKPAEDAPAEAEEKPKKKGKKKSG